MACIIWWFLFGLLVGFLLFWFFDKWFRRTGEADLKTFQSENSQLKAELDKSKKKMGASEFAYKPKVNGRDNLQIVEGIGPKIEQILIAAGINTFSDLASKKPEQISEALESAGSRFKLANPNSWPQQAKLCAEENWKELKEYQDYLDGGVDLAERQDD